MKGKKRFWGLMTVAAILLGACQGAEAVTEAADPVETRSTVANAETRPQQSLPDTMAATVPVTRPVTQPVTQPVTTASTAAVRPNPMLLGNLNRNYMDTTFAEDHNWVWYSDRADSNRLCRIRPDGSGQEQFDITDVSGKNIVGDDLFFIREFGDDYESFGLIYRMGSDGEVTQVSPVHANPLEPFMTVRDEIYFANLDDGNRLYRMKLDGSELTRMSEHAVFRLNADEGWIFYLVLPEDLWEIRRMRPDGSDDALLVEMKTFFEPDECGFDYLETAMFIADQGWLYYKDRSGLVQRVNYDNSVTETVLAEPIADYNGFTIDDEKLYFVSSASKHVMSCRLDGTDLQELTDRESHQVSRAGDWVYFISSEGWAEP